MGIKANFNVDKLFDNLKESFVGNIEGLIIGAFRLALEDAVNYSKAPNTEKKYTQQSGHLNSSTGYHLYKQGKLIDSYFGAGGGDGTGVDSGLKAGQEAAEEEGEALKHKWIAGVVVAGASYAAAVESGYRGKDKDGKAKYVTAKDVLTGAELMFPSFLETRLKEAFAGNTIDFEIIKTEE